MKSQVDTLKPIRLFTATKNTAVLRHLKAVLITQRDWSVEQDIEEAREQLRSGEGIPHEKVLKKFKKWL